MDTYEDEKRRVTYLVLCNGSKGGSFAIVV